MSAMGRKQTAALPPITIPNHRDRASLLAEQGRCRISVQFGGARHCSKLVMARLAHDSLARFGV